MEETLSRCKNLPIEILYKIFQKESARHLYNYALVCKAWTVPAQSVMYSNVVISNLSQLEKFHDTVKDNSRIGIMVKIFTIWIATLSNTTLEEVIDIMTNLLTTCLPNLEDLRDDCTRSLIPTLNALVDSKLKHLKRLGVLNYSFDKSEFVNYATCALLMKDRIESVEIKNINFIGNEVTSARQSYSNRLYNNLHQFSKLVELNLYKETNDDIQVLEYIIESCKSLKSLEVTFSRSDDDLAENDSTLIDEIIPSYTVEKFEVDVTLSNDYKVLFYFIQKFPQLQKGIFEICSDSNVSLDRHTLVQLLEYSAKIRDFNASGFQGNNDIICGAIGDYWDAKPTFGGESIKICYSSDYSEDVMCVFGISKKEDKVKTSFTYSYDESNHLGWKYTNLMQNSGKHLSELEFKIDNDEETHSTGSELPRNFISHTLKHCPNLRTLHLTSCIIKRFTHLEMDLRKKLSLDELYLDYCLLIDGALDQLSLILHRVKQVRLYNLIYRLNNGNQSDDEDDETTNNKWNVDIVMPYTKIDLVILENYFTIGGGPIYLKAFAVSESEYYYYIFNEKIQSSNEQEYLNDENSHFHVFICCQNQPQFQFSQRVKV